MSFQLLLEKKIEQFEILANRPNFDLPAYSRKLGNPVEFECFSQFYSCILVLSCGECVGREGNNVPRYFNRKLCPPRVAKRNSPRFFIFSLCLEFFFGSDQSRVVDDLSIFQIALKKF